MLTPAVAVRLRGRRTQTSAISTDPCWGTPRLGGAARFPASWTTPTTRVNQYAPGGGDGRVVAEASFLRSTVSSAACSGVIGVPAERSLRAIM